MSDVPNNIERFNAALLAVLTTLYEAFPVPVDLHVLAIVKAASDQGANATLDAAGYDNEASNAFSVAEQTVKWLSEEGYLRFESTMYPDGFGAARLSLRGLALLGLPDPLAGPSETYFTRAKKALVSGSVKGISESAQKILSGLLLAGVKVAFE